MPQGTFALHSRSCPTGRCELSHSGQRERSLSQRMAPSGNPLSQKEELPTPQIPDHEGPQCFWLQSWFLSVRVRMHGVSSKGLTLLLKTVPGDTGARNHQINSTVNPTAAPMSLPSLTWRLGSQLLWLIKYFQSMYDLRPPSGDRRNRAAGAGPHPAAVPAI